MTCQAVSITGQPVSRTDPRGQMTSTPVSLTDQRGQMTPMLVSITDPRSEMPGFRKNFRKLARRILTTQLTDIVGELVALISARFARDAARIDHMSTRIAYNSAHSLGNSAERAHTNAGFIREKV